MVDLYVDGVLRYHCITDSRADRIATELNRFGNHQIVSVFVQENGMPLTREEMTPEK